MAGARTIEIFLPDGEPTGVKVAHIRNRNIEATYIPRARLNDLKARESLQGVGIYLLVGESEQYTKPPVYIGEAEVVYTRLQQHNASKDFWNYCIALTSNNRHLTKTHVKFLEWLCHDKATFANRCTLENGNLPTKPHVQESTEADLYDNFESIDLLVSTLGLNIFQPLTFSKKTAESVDYVSDSFEYKALSQHGLQFEAKGNYTEEGFVVLAGSKFSNKLSESLQEPEQRRAMISDGVLVDDGNYLILKEDTLFSSPSAAGNAVSGRSTNGWTAWKRADGKTLNDVYRKAAA